MRCATHRVGPADAARRHAAQSTRRDSMPIVNFEEFCREFWEICEVADAPLPELVSDEHGSRALSVCIRECDVTAVQFGDVPAYIHLLLDLGEMPQHLGAAG